jgi:hypothetical protein
MLKDTLKRIFSYRFHLKWLLNPFIDFQINNLGDYPGTNNVKRETQIIVSLTSYRERFSDLPKTIYSLLNQSTKPDRIILWLDEECEDLTYLPYEITQFIKNGLEIRFVKDIGSYTKVIYAFKEFGDSIIVTADDDIYYPKDWLNKLYLSYITHPEDIQVHRAHRVKIEENQIIPYEQWEKHVDEETARFDNFLTGVGGVLYPPNCFGKEVLREDIFLKNAPFADDIWFWVMALVYNRKIRVVQEHIKTLITTSVFRQLFSKTLYDKNKKGENDKQLNNLLKYYKQNIFSKIK